MVAGEEASSILLEEAFEDHCPSIRTHTNSHTHTHKFTHTHMFAGEEASFMLFEEEAED
jgi:hypothetical protein